MDRAPVGHDEIRIAPVGLQHLIEKPVVFARIAAVHLIVGAHDAAWPPALDGDFEGQQIRLAHRGWIDTRVEDDPVGFLRIERKMLDRRDDAPAALHACNHAPSHDAGEQRVFGEIFKIAPATRVTNEICGAAKKHIEALGSRFGADGFALKPRHIWAPGRGEGEIGRHRGRRVAVTDVPGIGDAKLRIRLLQCGNAEARHAGHVAGRTNRPIRSGLAAPSRRDHAMDQRQLLLLGHLVERQLRAPGGRQGSIHPRPVLRRRGSAEGQARKDNDRGKARRTGSLSGQISPLA